MTDIIYMINKHSVNDIFIIYIRYGNGYRNRYGNDLTITYHVPNMCNSDELKTFFGLLLSEPRKSHDLVLGYMLPYFGVYMKTLIKSRCLHLNLGT